MSEIPISNNPKPPKRGERVMAKDIAELWQAVKRLAARQDTIRPHTFPNPKLAPLTVTLHKVYADPVTWEVFTQYGHVVPRHNASGDAGTPIGITSLPTETAPLAVVLNTKLWVRVTVNAYGKATAAVWQSNTTWPSDSPPELIGGDDQTGAAGVRYVRLCEIVTVDSSVKVKVIHTGNIEHSAPTLTENLTISPSTGEARVMKLWNASAGRWDFRYLVDGDGITITENANTIEIKANLAYSFPSTHPWKVTNGGSGNAAIAAGFIQGYFLTYSEASPTTPGASTGYGVVGGPDSIVLGPAGTYAGGTTAITGTQYIYAEIGRGASNEYSESYDDHGGLDLLVELFDEIDPSLLQTATIVVSSSAADSYTPTTGYAAVCIAKVTNTAGTITVDAQYTTHNPTLFLPILLVSSQAP